MAGLTITPIKRLKYGNEFGQISQITFDDSYPTGGESLTPAMLGLNVIDFIEFEPVSGYAFEYVRSTKKVKVMVPVSAVASTGAADANNTLMKSATGTVEVAGTGTAFQVVAAEVANTADLHTLVTRVKATGW